MTSAFVVILSAIASYLLGAIPFGYVISRARGVDIRRVGSGNIGATNVFRSVGKPWGILTFVCDFLKGFGPAIFFPLVAARLAPTIHPEIAGIVCALAAVAGHNWPIYLGFKGGKGVATSAGALLGIAWQAVLIGLVAWVVIFLLTRYVSVASIAAALSITVSSWILYARNSTLLLPIALTLLAAVIVWRHKGNIQRLRSGTEHRFEFKRKTPAPPVTTHETSP